MRGNEVIFVDNNQRFMWVPAKETADAEMLVVPQGFTERWHKAYHEWQHCQSIINQAMTGQDIATVEMGPV
jgi:hypothetical protein